MPMHATTASPTVALADESQREAIELSIVIVSWNVWPLLRDCLGSIAQVTAPVPSAPAPASAQRLWGPQGAWQLEVIVVDNASSDETTTALPCEFPWVHLIQSGGNLGFTRSNNIGYRASRGAYVFFLNPDTSLTAAAQPAPGADPLTLLHRTIATDPTIGMVGPQLRYGDGSWQNSRRRFPTRWTGFFESTWLGQRWPTNPWARQMHMVNDPASAQHEVDWLNGSAMFCRRAALAAICAADDPGPFDEQFFMYSEELDLCQRMVQAGWRIVYVPETTVVHYEGRSSEQIVMRRHIFFNTSKIRYYQKYFGPRWAALLRLYLRSEYLIQLVVESLKWLMRHKTALRRERIAAYRAILRNGFRSYW
ncbi:MAG TPA: glycosyltransferase family 2 protein [Caldilineaceae bacterium]|nr:glycosyltransferase family 2 protein [Caldilineaceae bacterium]